ncbi:unnamed protein product, partial [Ectocarpus fasciculatus]
EEGEITETIGFREALDGTASTPPCRKEGEIEIRKSVQGVRYLVSHSIRYDATPEAKSVLTPVCLSCCDKLFSHWAPFSVCTGRRAIAQSEKKRRTELRDYTR